MECKKDGKLSFDVITTAIPMLMTEKNISGFLDSMEDRDDFYLRWLFHLDQYEGLELDWESNLVEAGRMSQQFDESLLIASRINCGMGTSIRRCMLEVQSNVLWIEDDWEWRRKFRLADFWNAVVEEGANGFSFTRVGGKIGMMHPTCWGKEVVDDLLVKWPGDQGFTDQKSQRILRRGTGYKNALAPKVPRKPCHHIGSVWLLKKGYTYSHTGKRLDGKRGVVS